VFTTQREGSKETLLGLIILKIGGLISGLKEEYGRPLVKERGAPDPGLPP